MTIRPILEHPDPILRTVCGEVTSFDDALTDLVDDMFETMYAAKGRGLAAPQIGEVTRVFVMDCAWKEGDRTPCVFINPKIVYSSSEWGRSEEGCLSIPGQTSVVSRPNVVEMVWQSATGTRETARFDGFEAVCVQHELDHIGPNPANMICDRDYRLRRRLQNRMRPGQNRSTHASLLRSMHRTPFR